MTDTAAVHARTARRAGSGLEAAPLLLTLAAAALAYAAHALRLADGAIMRAGNLAFDFDVIRFRQLWCDPVVAAGYETYFIARHPLTLAARPVCQALTAAGASPGVALVAVPILCGLLATYFAYRIARSLDLGPLEAAALATLFAFSNTALTVFALPEAYGPALLGLMLQFLLLAEGARRAAGMVTGREGGWVAAGVLTLGATITNYGLSLLALAASVLWPGADGRALPRAVVVAAATGIVVAVASAALLVIYPAPGIDGPFAFVRQLWWSANAGAEARTGPLQVAITFGLYAQVAPPLDALRDMAPNLPLMFDYRSFYAGPLSLGLALAWAALAVVGSVAALRPGPARPLAIAALLWLAANLALHTVWQMRGSLFLYSAHPYAALWVLGALGAARLRKGGGAAVTAALIVLALATAAVNWRAAEDFAATAAAAPGA